MSIADVKPVVKEAIVKEAKSLNDLSQAIWNNPELNFEEEKAHAVLTDYLEAKGFTVQRHYILGTAFRAEFISPAGAGDVTICIMCEYDALPGIGHACGHNLIAEAGVGAALGVKAAMQGDGKVAGRLVVMGTPAEEGGGGKIILMKAGALDDIDFALMAHPTLYDALNIHVLAIQSVEVRFVGKEAHASAAPWAGINALDAAVSCYASIGLLRQQMMPTWRVHGIISKGGVKPNIIPGETQMLFSIRAPTWKEVEYLKAKVVACFEAAAKSTGCKLEYEFQENSNYDSLLLNGPMLEAYRAFAEEEGVQFVEPPNSGSTDMGNVSRKIPAIHPMFSIPTTAVNHTKQFAADAGAPEAQRPTLRTAECLALTTVQLFTDAKLREESRKAFDDAQQEGSVADVLDDVVAEAFAKAKARN